jgi:hypothetical protein
VRSVHGEQPMVLLQHARYNKHLDLVKYTIKNNCRVFIRLHIMYRYIFFVPYELACHWILIAQQQWNIFEIVRKHNNRHGRAVVRDKYYIYIYILYILYYIYYYINKYATHFTNPIETSWQTIDGRRIGKIRNIKDINEIGVLLLLLYYTFIGLEN